jgi:hypothetical protein
MSGMAYALVQHGLRAEANDPQIQVAQDAAHALDIGASPAKVIPPDKVDIGSSLGLVVAVYDANHNQLGGDAELNGTAAAPPAGALDAGRSGTNIVTWQPAEGVRMALVVVPWKGGVVMSARSLSLVESRIADIGRLTVIGWLFSLVVGLIVCAVAARIWLLRPQPIAATLPERGRPPAATAAPVSAAAEPGSAVPE